MGQTWAHILWKPSKKTLHAVPLLTLEIFSAVRQRVFPTLRATQFAIIPDAARAYAGLATECACFLVSEPSAELDENTYSSSPTAKHWQSINNPSLYGWQTFQFTTDF